MQLLRKRMLPRKSGWLALLLLVPLTTACATMRSVGTDISCEAFQPITWSSQDTDETAAQVRAHNRAFVALCGPPDE